MDLEWNVERIAQLMLQEASKYIKIGETPVSEYGHQLLRERIKQMLKENEQ